MPENIKLTVAFSPLLWHTRKALLKGEDFVFEKVTEDVWKLLEIINRRRRGFVYFA